LQFLIILLQWLHVLFAMSWFGISLSFLLLIGPSAAKLSTDQQSAWWSSFAARAPRIFPAVAGATVLFGILRGLAVGVWSFLGTPYGVTWVAALVLGIGLAVWGARFTAPAVERLAGSGPADLPANVARATRIGMIEQGGFLVIFTLMIAMRFGY
jgi:uncharacterized membrane protein